MESTKIETLDAAVLLLIFNRPDTTDKVFQAIKIARPKRLYVSADGPRVSKIGEQELCEKARQIINQVDWDCEVKTLFRDINLGCKLAVSEGITWFFKHEEMGIILEDDCLPSQSFFLFCDKLLNRYKNDFRIWHIAGTSTLSSDILLNNDSFYFSNFNHIWGWASWANRWEMYDRDICLFNEFIKMNYIENITKNTLLQKFWISNFKSVFNKKFDTWDYQWYFTTWINRGISIIPTVNLVSNIGFSEDATHTLDIKNKLSNMERYEIDLNLVYPKIIMPNTIYDNYNANFLFGLNYYNYLRNELKKIIKRLIKFIKND